MLNWPRRLSWLLLLRHEVALILQIKACASRVSQLEMLNDALAALIGVGSSRTGTAVSLYVRTLRASGVVAKLIEIALIYPNFA